MITWLLTSLIDWVASLVLALLNWLVLAVSSNVGLSGDDTFEAMQQAFPMLKEFYPGIVTCGLFISFMICMFQVFKALFGPLAEAESPVTLVCRTVGFVVLVAFSSTICSIFIDIGTAPYQWITTTMEGYAGEKMSEAFADPPDVGTFSDWFVAPGDEEDVAGMLAGAAVFAWMPGLSGLLIIIMLVMIVKKYFALLMEVVERYVILGFLVFIAPLCIATGASRATNFVFKGWIQMMISQLILMCFGLLFLAVTNEAIVNWLKAWTGGGSGEGVAKNPIMMFLLLMSWLRIGQNVDNYMSSLGLKAAHAGGGLGNDIMAGVSQGMPIANAVSNKMLGTNYGQPGGFKSAAHELFGSAAKKNAVKAGGHNLGIASPGSMKNALKNASGGEKLAALGSMGRNSNSLISPKGVTEAAKQQSAQKSLDAMINQGVNAAAGSKTGMTDIGATALGLTGSGVNLDESKTSMKDGVMHLEGTDANGNAFSADIAKTGAKEAENGVPILDANGNPTGYSMVGGEINDADLQKQLLGDNVDNAANAGLAAGDTTTSQPGAPNTEPLSENNAIDGTNFEGENGEKLHMDEDGVLRDENGEAYNGAVSMTDAEGNAITANALDDDGNVGAALKTDENGNLVVEDGKFQTEDGKAVDGDHVVGQSLDTQTAADGAAVVGAQDYKGDVNFQDGDGNDVQAFKTDDNGDLVKDDNGNAVPLTANNDGTFTDVDGHKVDDKNVGFSADGGETTVDKNDVQAVSGASFQDGNGNDVKAFKTDDNGNLVKGADGNAVPLRANNDGTFTDSKGNKIDDKNVGFSADGGETTVNKNDVQASNGVSFQDDNGNNVKAFKTDDNGNLVKGADGNAVPLRANANGTFTDSNGNKIDDKNVGFSADGGKTSVDKNNVQATGGVSFQDGSGNNVKAFKTDDNGNLVKGADGNAVPLRANANGTFTDSNGNKVDGKNVGFSADGGKTSVDKNDVQATGGPVALGKGSDGQYTIGGQALTANYTGDYNGKVSFQDARTGDALNARALNDKGVPTGENLKANADGTFSNKAGDRFTADQVGFVSAGSKNNGNIVDNQHAQAVGSNGQKLGVGANGQYTAQKSENITKDANGNFVGMTTGNAYSANQLQGAPTSQGKSLYGVNQNGDLVAATKSNGKYVDDNGNALSNVQAYGGTNGAKQLSGYSVGADGSVNKLERNDKGQWVGTDGKVVTNPVMATSEMGSDAAVYGQNSKGEMVRGKLDANGNVVSAADGKTALTNVSVLAGMGGASQLSGYSIDSKGQAHELKQQNGQWVGADGKAVANPVMAPSGHDGSFAYGKTGNGNSLALATGAGTNGERTDAKGNTLSGVSLYSGSNVTGAATMEAGTGKAVSTTSMGAAASLSNNASVAHNSDGNVKRYGMDSNGNAVQVFANDQARVMTDSNGKAVQLSSQNGTFIGNGINVMSTGDARVGFQGVGFQDSKGNTVQAFKTDENGKIAAGAAPLIASSNGTFTDSQGNKFSSSQVSFSADGGKTAVDKNSVQATTNGQNIKGSGVSANYSYSSKSGEALTPVSKNAQGVYENVSPNADGTFSVGNRTISASNVQFRDSNGQVGTQSVASALSSGAVSVSGGDKLTDKNTGAAVAAVLVAPAGSYVSADNKTVETASSAFASVGKLGANDTLRSGNNGYYVENSADNSHKSSLQMYGNVGGRSVPLQASSNGGYEYMGNDGRMQSYSGAVSALNESGQYTNRVSADDAGMTLRSGTMVKTSNRNMDSSYTTSLNSQGTHVMDTSGHMYEVAASSISSGGNIVSNNGEIALANGSTISASSVATNNDGSVQGFSVASASFGKTESGSGQMITLGEAKTIAGTGETYYQIGNSGQYISASAFEKTGGNSVSGEGYQTYSQSTPLVAEGKDGSFHGVSSDCMRYNANNEPCANGEFMRDSNTGELFHTTGNVYAGKERVLETGMKPEEAFVPSTNPTHVAVAGGGYVALQSSQRYDANGNRNNDGDYYKAADGSQVPVTQGGYEVAYSVGGIKSDADGRITIPAGATINKNDNGTVSFHTGGTEYKIHPAGTYDKASNKDAVSIGDGRIITQQNHQYERACSWAEQGNRSDGIYHGAEAQSMAAAIGIDPRNVKSAGISQDKKQVAIVMNDNTARVYSSQGSIGYGHRVEGGVHMTPVDKTSLAKGTPSISMGKGQSGSGNVKSVGSSMRTAHTIRDKDFEAQQQEEKNNKPRKNRK